MRFYVTNESRSQAVARLVDRTATQQTHVRSYAKNCRGHVT